MGVSATGQYLREAYWCGRRRHGAGLAFGFFRPNTHTHTQPVVRRGGCAADLLCGDRREVNYLEV